MSKKVFEIEKSEEFMAGWSTSVIVNLAKDGKGIATVNWKRGEYKQVPVAVGQRLALNMYGSFPEIQVWDAPKAPKDPIKKFLWDKGFTAKKVWSWEDERFVNYETSEFLWNLNAEFTKVIGCIKFLVHSSSWVSSMSGQEFIGSWVVKGIAITQGTTLEQLQADWVEFEKYNDVDVVQCP